MVLYTHKSWKMQIYLLLVLSNAKTSIHKVWFKPAITFWAHCTCAALLLDLIYIYIYIYNYIIYIITSYVWAVSRTCNKLTKPSNSHFYFILIKIIQQIKQYSILYIHKWFSNYYTLPFFPSKKYKMHWKRKYLWVCIYEIWFNLNLRTCCIKK